MEDKKSSLVKTLVKKGYIKSENVKQVLSKVRRELFLEEKNIDKAYLDQPLEIPGEQTMSAPHIHALVLSELELKEGQNVMEIGAGSGILLAYMQELVGKSGRVVGIELNRESYQFGKTNLENSGYDDVLIVQADGSRGFPHYAPYDRIVVSAASPEIPKILLGQLKMNGIMITVVGSPYEGQKLIKLKVNIQGKITTTELADVMFVPLKGKYGIE